MLTLWKLPVSASSTLQQGRSFRHFLSALLLSSKKYDAAELCQGGGLLTGRAGGSRMRANTSLRTMTPARMFRVKARLRHPSGPSNVFAMGVSVVAQLA
jgi:hypothetical protein